jgi:hypothetical protein
MCARDAVITVIRNSHHCAWIHIEELRMLVARDMEPLLAIAKNKSLVRSRLLAVIASFLYSAPLHYSSCHEGNKGGN